MKYVSSPVAACLTHSSVTPRFCLPDLTSHLRAHPSITVKMAATQGLDDIAPKVDNHSTKSVDHSASDLEKQQTPQADELKRKLSSRHLQFVAIGTLLTRSSQVSSADLLQAELSVLVSSLLVEARSTQLAPQAHCLPMSSSVLLSTRS